MEIWQMFGFAFVLFVIVGLPFLSRYMPYIRGKDDVSDPTKDPMRKEEHEDKSNKPKGGNGWLLLRRAVEIYALFFLLIVLLNWFYGA